MRTLLLSLVAAAALAAQHATFSTSTDVVVVNISVLDKNGKPIGNLKAGDFQLFEDGKLQKLQALDYQHLKNAILPTQMLIPRSDAAPKTYNPEADQVAVKSDLLSKYQDRRLIAMLFDFSSMLPAEQIRAKAAAIKFLKSQMTASDTVSIMIYGSSLKTVRDFTPDRDLLIETINRFRIGDSSENAVYISSGIQKNGVDNQAQLRATINTAIRSNVAFYPIDARGLSALVPAGDATQAGSAGTNLYSGTGQRSLKENFNNQQETLATLALDTGGKALLDSNDLTDGMRQVQSDFSSYYVLTYVSTNKSNDGRYRKIQVKLAANVANLKPKLTYREGYYGPTAFGHLREEDKEAQLSEALLSENPITDLRMAVEVGYFRLENDKYVVPINVKIPGAALAFQKKGAKQATELDFIAEVRDVRHRPAATVRDTIPLKVGEDIAGQVARKSIQYDTGVTLSAGKYTLRFVARENGEGKTGTFESVFTIPI